MGIGEHVDKETLIKIIEAIPFDIFYKKPDGKYVFSSHYGDRNDLGDDWDIYGKTDKEIQKDASNIAESEELDREVVEKGTLKQFTIKANVGEEYKYLDILKGPVRDDDGNISGIVGVVNDITRATKEVANMLENEKAYQTAMRADAFLAYNVNLSSDTLSDELIEYIDGVELNLLDFVGMKVPCSYKEFMNKWATATMCEEYRQEFIDYHLPERLIDIYNSGKSQLTIEKYVEVIDVNGQPKGLWMNENILLMQNIDKDIIAFVTLKDATEERVKEMTLRKQLEDAVDEATRANSAKNRFLANTSHEIRTPMNAIVGMVEVLLREETDPKKIDYLNNIKDSGLHLLEIINDILDFSKIESGKLEIIPDVYELRARIDSLIMLLNERIGDKDIELTFNLDERLPKFLYGDATRIRQVIINLVNNAIKFTDKGFVKVTVSVDELTDTELTETICIEDSGIGIKEEEMDKLFGAFNRLDKRKTVNIEGTGLGLAISKQLVALMGGDLQVSSTYGVGTKFFFTIKQGVVKDKDAKVKNKEKVQKEREGRMFKAPRAKILLADDSAVNVKVFKALVAPTGMQIDVAENGKIAVDKVTKNDYDLVLMDHMMPVMNGIEATKCIRSFGTDKSDILIIALTANAVVGVREQFMEAGMNDFLTKPVRIKELLTMLRKYLPEEYIEEIEE